MTGTSEVEIRRKHNALQKKLFLSICFAFVINGSLTFASGEIDNGKEYLDWQSLPDLPESLGLAGAFVGVHTCAKHECSVCKFFLGALNATYAGTAYPKLIPTKL